MIELKNINKYYQSSEGKFHALNDINLTLPDKGMVYIVGKSGSGKSTLLNVIGGIDKYDSGSLTISNLNEENGQKVENKLNTASFTKKDYNAFRNTYIGFIFQEFNVVKGLTVYENVALSLDLQRLPVKDEQILEILEKVGLKGKEKRRINELSGGERQRVAIARALVKNPMVIIADEPTGNLDAKNRDIVMDILKNLSKEKLVLIVTHDKYLASRYGDREITIKDGQIINDETYHNENLITGIVSTYKLKPIYPKSIVSLKLAWSNFKLNKLRFILIILLFSISLIFAGGVVNLYLADTTKEYAIYQKDYGNNVVSLSNKYTYHDNTSSTGFFAYDLQVAKNEFKVDETNSMTTYTSMPINIPIINYTNPSQFTNKNGFYSENISNITIYDSVSQLKSNFSGINENEAVKYNDYYCYITDYLVMSLLYSNYYNAQVTTTNITSRYLEIEGLNKRIYIAGVITTNYLEFANLMSVMNYYQILKNMQHFLIIYLFITLYSFQKKCTQIYLAKII